MADNVDPKVASSVPTATDVVTYSGDAGQNVQLVRQVNVSGAEGSKTVDAITDANGAFQQGPVAHDAPQAGNPILIGGRASAAAPADVSADNDAVRAWLLRNGAQAVNITAAGALIPGDATDGLKVQISGAALTSLQLIDDSLIADDAAFTVGTSKVNMAGYQAVAHGSNPDAADALDAVVGITNRHRVQFMIGGHPNITTIRLQFTAAQTDVAIITVGAGTKIVVTALQVTLDNASTVFPSVRIGFGTANTPTTTGVVAAHGGVPAGGGFGRGDGSGIIGIGADNEDLRITTVGAATGNGVEVVVTYFTIES